VIKVLREGARAAAHHIERFLREVKLASRLDHPYAAHIYGFGAEPDQLIWIAMEHVRGITLDRLVAERGRMPPAVFAPLFGRLCEVVHSAHELGIVHRDIKGNNVMVIERSGQLLPKLLDFGIAKLTSADDAALSGVPHDNRQLTLDGITMGTPLYMSPEQWQDPTDVDPRADIYALGVLAYHCLSGRFPFEHRNRDALRAAHLLDEPPRLEKVPAPLAAAVARSLAKQRDDRFGDALAFAEAVRVAVGVELHEAVPIFDPVEREAWLRRGPQPIADAMARLATAGTTVEADSALRELIAITCRWLAVIALSGLATGDDQLVEPLRAVVDSDASTPWLRLAQAAIAKTQTLPGLAVAFTGSDLLGALAERLDARDRARTPSALASDIAAAAEALGQLEPMLRYQLVVGRRDGAERWQGQRRRERERVVVWGELDDGEVALLDEAGRVQLRLSPFVQVRTPLPSLEPELFMLWRAERRSARLVAAPWGFEHDDERVGERLATLTTDERASSNQLADKSPYLGLAAYAIGDADRFVGRETEIEALVNRLVRAPMVAVLGASGVGKSSFLHAGVLPRLAGPFRVVTMRPGRHPMQALASALSAERDRDVMVAKLRADGEAAPRGLILAIDQLEELVTLCSDVEERREFGETLALAADGSGAPVRVVATLRDDFASVVEGTAAVRGKFEVYVLANPSREALRRIFTEPARRSGVAIEPSVVDAVVDEIAGRPAALPLLSFAAAQLWELRDPAKHRIEHDAYTALGGVAGALASYADEVYQALGARDRDTARDLFARLVAANGTRIPAPRAELEQLPGAATVLGHLIDARLLVARDDDEGDAIEIVHECLAERWPRLARWRREDAEDRALLADVSGAARRWDEQGRRTDLLWRGRALDDLRNLVARSTALTDLERAFASECDRAARRARTLRSGAVAGAMAMLVAIAAVMSYFDVAARDAAKLAEDRLTASLIAQGRRELTDGRSIHALAYFGAALQRGADGTGLRAMVALASRGWRDLLVTRYNRATTAMAATLDGSWIAASDASGMVRWWSPTGAPLGELAPGVGAIELLVAPAGARMLAAGHDGLAVIDVRERRVLARISLDDTWWSVNAGPGDDEVTVLLKSRGLLIVGWDGATRRTIESRFTGTTEPVFDARGDRLFAFASGELSVIDLVTMTRHLVSRTAAKQPTSSADGAARGYIEANGEVRLLDDDGKVIRTIATAGHPDGLAFSPTGDRFAISIGRDADIYTADGAWHHHVTIDDGARLALRGDEAWTSDRLGVVRHYRGSDLVASTPTQVAKIDRLALAGDALATLGNDSSFAIIRASAAHLRDFEIPCTGMQRGAVGLGIVHSCATAGQRVYVGTRLIEQSSDKPLVFDIAVDDASDRVAIASENGLVVRDPGGARIATLDASHRPHALAFADADHLIVAAADGVWRWSLPDRLERVVDDRDASAVAAVAAGIAIGHRDGKVRFVAGARDTPELALGEPVEHLVASPDRRWIVATLASGAAAVLDGSTGRVARMLETTGHSGMSSAATSFDVTGSLLLRAGTSLSIWDRASGDRLISDVDLFGTSVAGRFRADGRLELAGAVDALLDIPRDDRSSSAILHDITCHVPLRATGDRLEPATTTECAR
jgi:hypothetical protein